MTFFNRFYERLVAEVGGDLPERLGRRIGPDKIDLEPGDAVPFFHHLRHVVDGAVAHDDIQICRMGARKLIVLRVAAEGGVDGQAALYQ